MKRARCPLCERTVNTQDIDGRLCFVPHRVSRRGRGGGPRCEGSLWLVEDEDLVTLTPAGIAGNKARADLAAARQTTTEHPACRRCRGAGEYEGDRCRCCGGTGTESVWAAAHRQPLARAEAPDDRSTTR